MKANQPRDFYDKFNGKLIKDYLLGNPRMEAALEFSKYWVAKREGMICDIGCGLGWSTFEFVKIVGSERVYGIDFSEVLIELGKSVFHEAANCYYQHDLTNPNWPLHQGFNTCVLIDVFEHIPKAARSVFYSELNRILTDDACIILTCPSIYHQDYLRRENPEGLQPVDENITLEVLQEFAAAINGAISLFELKSIWFNNDYLHAIISKGLARTPKVEQMRDVPELETIKQRFARIRSCYGQEFLEANRLTEPQSLSPLTKAQQKIFKLLRKCKMQS